jgi:WD40 repeat protein
VSNANGPSALLAAIQAEGESLEERLATIGRFGRTSRRYTELGEIYSRDLVRITRVRDESLQRELAMKIAPVLPPRGKDAQVHARVLHRLLDEALITAHLDHPGIVPIIERLLDEERGLVLFSMPLVRGHTLKHVFELVRAGAQGWTLHRALGVLHKVCETVAFAHEKGVIHRDLKPENIMVGPFGETYVMDWGLALVLGREEDSVVGTLAYMAPEQAAGRYDEVGPQADVYSLGAILYELLGGAHPHRHSIEEGHAPEELIGRRPRPMHELAPGVPPELVAICEKAMAHARQRRYPDAKALAADLQAWLEGRVVEAYETGTWAHVRKWCKRNPKLALTLSALGLTLLAVPVQQYFRIRQVQEESRKTRYENYVANLGAANLGLRALEIRDAQRRLEQCAEDFRGWEWEHLRLRADSSLGSIDVPGEAQFLAVDPEGRFVAVGTAEGEVGLCEPEDGGAVTVLGAHASPLVAVALSSDGSRLASLSEDGTVHLWDTGTRRNLWEGRGTNRASALAFASGTDELAAAGRTGRIVLWSADDPRPTGEIETDSVGALAFDPSTGHLLSAHTAGRIRVWDTASRTCLREVEIGTVLGALAVHPLGSWLAVARDQEIRVLEMQEFTPIARLDGHELPVTSLAIAPGGRLLSGSSDNTVRLWNPVAGEELALFVGHADRVNSVGCFEDGRRFVSGSEDGTVRLWDLDGRAELHLEGHADAVTSLAFRPDGERLASASLDGTLRIWRSGTGELLETIPVAMEVASLVYLSRDEIAFGPRDSHPRLGAPSSTTQWRELGFGEIDAGTGVFAATLLHDPGSGALFARCPDGIVARWNPGGREPAFLASGFDAQASAFAIEPGGKFLAVGSVDGRVSLIDAGTGELVRDLESAPSGVTMIAFAAERDLAALGLQDGTIRVLSLSGDAPARRFEGHERLVTALAFDARGERLVSGSEDGTLRIWDVERSPAADASPASGETVLLTLGSHAKGITALAFRPGGDAIASASKDGTVRIWRAHPSRARPR